MVLQLDALLVLKIPMLRIQSCNAVACPGAHKAVEELEENAGGHSKLGKRVRKSEQHLCHLLNIEAQGKLRTWQVKFVRLTTAQS